ncbi:hypothetical protein K2173_027816 [Erythroxylum novogranatense]|uniref:SWIRM domain-containing protein n=1 Tax=Erythroxylum novogranatense TaxID=1862640 RepID=A0AAV8U301_9ROSI|nr:hypothetical protein K2173_027816 [Erythroxylum novogranatense]
MESGDLSGYRTVQSKLGLEEKVLLVQKLLRSRVKRMEGEEKKCGAKKRSKKPIGVGLESDDNEPIVSLIKLKKAGNSKKGKRVLGRVDAKEEKLVVKDGNFGGMDDTLASFRKKLRGPRKDIGPASAQPLEGSVERGCNEGNDALDMIMNKKVEDKHTGGVKQLMIDAKREETGNSAVVEDCSGNLGSQDATFEGQRDDNLLHEQGTTSNSCDEKLEESISSLSQKAQFGMMGNSCTNPSLKDEKRSQIFEDGSTVASVGAGVFKSLPNRSTRFASALDVACEDLRIKDRSHKVYGLNQSDSASEQRQTVVDEKFDNNFYQAANCVEDNNDAIKELQCVQESNDEDMRFDRIRHDDRSSTDFPEGPASPSPLVSHYDGVDDDHKSDLSDEICSLSVVRDCLQTPSLKNGLKGEANTMVNDIAGMPSASSASMQSQVIHTIGEGKLDRVMKETLDHQSKDAFSLQVSNADPQISFVSSKQVPVPTFKDELSNKLLENALEDIHKQAFGKTLGDSFKHLTSESSQSCLKENDNVSKTENGFDLCPKVCQYSAMSTSRFVSQKETHIEQDDPYGCNQPHYLTPFSSQKQNAAVSEAETDSNMVHYAPLKNCSSIVYTDQFTGNAHTDTCTASRDYLSTEAQGNGASPSSVSPEEHESSPEDAVSLPDSEVKDGSLSKTLRALRKHKKRRFRDMAYEGDADWEILLNEQCFLETDQVFDNDRSYRTREKSDSSSISPTEAETNVGAAVLAGLKARAAGPLEKIRFKEVLKRKGGLQEYLECRNFILGLWSKDVSRVLPLAECGVQDVPSVDESPRASLIREIYTFLDKCGYINVGIASVKDKAESGAQHNYKVSEDKKFQGSPGPSQADLEDGVSFILGRVDSEAKHGVATDDENLASNSGRGVIMPMTLELPNVIGPDECQSDAFRQNVVTNPILSKNLADFDVSSSIKCCQSLDSSVDPVITPDTRSALQNVQPSSFADSDGGYTMYYTSEQRKKIIVVGAGPAGLTAARHLQRQGFSVVVLEARNRIGGRVYTDRSSLSVPVDLGASIITGIEADVTSERRPDPSSLICSQLGLDLTVLHSDCPLYDIVTGEKVPRDLDEALEAEFNSLLDDMLLLVEQKGEHATKMSLEDGLEFALKMRRMAQPLTMDISCDLRTCGGGGDPDKSYFEEGVLSPLERRVMDWHFANLEYGCAALLKEVSLPHWNQDDIYGGFGGAHCMIKGGYSNVLESLGEGVLVHLNHVVTDISYGVKDEGVDEGQTNKVKVCTSNGSEFVGDAALITVPLGCLKAGSIKFSPPLPSWKISSIQRLGFGVLNKVVLEFPEVFWDDSVDYFGATAKGTDHRGQCFMFWNVRKTVGAPVLIALVVGRAALDGETMSSCDHVNHALKVLRKLFGEAAVPDPLASVVTDWGRDPFSYGAYSYVAIGSSGEDYDILGRPVENCLFFAGEATCKEHPDTVGGAMMSGLREAVRIIDILTSGIDYTAEVEAMEAAQKQSEHERDEVMDITRRLDAVELSSELYKNSLDRARNLTREALLKDLFFSVKSIAGRLHLVKELLNLPVQTLKSFAGTRKGLSMLNSWILDSMGKDGTQLLRHCVRLLVLVSTDLLAVRLSGIGKTVKEKVCVHTSRDIRAIASQLVSVWLEVFRRKKASNGGLKLKKKLISNAASGRPPLHTHHGALENKGSIQAPASSGSPLPYDGCVKKVSGRAVKLGSGDHSKLESRSQASPLRLDGEVEEENTLLMSEAEKTALAAAEAASAAARAAAEAYASSEAKCSAMQQLPKIPSFHKFARREHYTQMDDHDLRRKWPGSILGRQDCISEIDSRNCRVRDWSVDFSAARVDLDSSRMLADNLSQRSHSNEIASQINLREQSGDSAAVDGNLFTKAWVDTAGSAGIKDYHAIERWQSQAAAADSEFFHPAVGITDEEHSNTSSRQPSWKNDGRVNESSVSQVTLSRENQRNHSRGPDRTKQAVVDFVASLLMPLYKARKIDKEGYKSIMKKCATKVMEQATDAQKAMTVSEFLDSKRKYKIRAFVDKLIEKHLATKISSKL